MTKPQGQTFFATVAVAALWLFGWIVGYKGLDYGEHWDEWYAQEGTVHAVENLELFPGDFTYNGVYFDLAAVPVFGKVIASFPTMFPQLRAHPTRPMDPTKYSSIAALKESTIPYVKSTRYLLDTRAIYLFCSLLAILGVALTGFALWPRRVVAGITGAALAALSWELGYHCRYIAVDSLMAMLSAFMFASMAWARTTRSATAAQLGWVLAAVCGGLAFGCKVTGIVYAVPIGVGAFFSPALPFMRWREGIGLRLRRVALTAVVYVVTFLLSTPGFLRDPIRFATGVFHTSATYGRGKFAYATDGLVDHTTKFFTWLFVDVPSPWWPFSLALMFFAGVGARRLWRRDRELAIAGVFFVLAYGFIVLKAGQFVARNALPLVPVLFLCIAAGIDIVVEAASGRVKAIVVAGLVAGFIANAAFDVWAMVTIRTTTRASIIKDTGDWLVKHNDRTLWVGPRLYRETRKKLKTAYTCTPAKGKAPDDARAALFFIEHPRKKWKSNNPRFYEKHFSSQETNLLYYSNWRAHHYRNRTVVMPTSTLTELRVKTRGWVACTPIGSKDAAKDDPKDEVDEAAVDAAADAAAKEAAAVEEKDGKDDDDKDDADDLKD